MSDVIEVIYNSGAPAGTIMVTLRRTSDRYMYRASTMTYEANDDTHIANYGVALTDRGGDLYSLASWPTGFDTNTPHIVTVYDEPTGTLATSSLIVSAQRVISGVSVTAAAAGTDASITVSEARTWVRQFARNAQSSTAYGDAQIDRAIMLIGNDVRRRTNYGRKHDTVTITANTNAIDCSAISGFTARKIVQAWITGQAGFINIVPYERVRTALITGQPQWCGGADSPYYMLDLSSQTVREIGFLTETTGIAAWTPTADTNLELLWHPAFTGWTAGDSGASAYGLNLPDEYLQGALAYGAPGVLQINEPEHAQTVLAQNSAYVDFVNSLGGGDGLGQQSYQKNGAWL